jgi:plastocyanin
VSARFELSGRGYDSRDGTAAATSRACLPARPRDRVRLEQDEPRSHRERFRSLDLAADPSGAFKFDRDQIEIPSAGPVRLVMTNPSSVPHNIAIKGNGVSVKGKEVRSGDRSVVTATLKSGSYEFYCSIDAHEQAGMKGTLVVGGSQ